MGWEMENICADRQCDSSGRGSPTLHLYPLVKRDEDDALWDMIIGQDDDLMHIASKLNQNESPCNSTPWIQT